LVLEQNAVLRWKDIPEAPVRGWYRMRVAAAGICGSDIGRGFHNGAYHYPLVMGHEFSAVVMEAPPGGRIAPGTLCAVYPLLPCGRCAACGKGWIQLCEHYDYFGSRRDGAFAEELWVPEANLLPVPDGVSAEEAALAEPAAVAHRGTHGFEIPEGARCLVVGGGPIGLLAAQWLRIRGAASVAVADIDPAKRAFAERLGFETGYGADVSSSFGGAAVSKRQFDIVVEACGLAATRAMAIERCASRGVVSFIGNPADDWTFPKALFSSALRREISARFNWNSLPDPDWREALAHAGRDLDLKHLVTAHVPLPDGAAAFGRIVARDGFNCKTLLVNTEGGRA
jgi:L-iditol 2-dehydrogenase/galactitol-1-phosphate 5-dehydrogenase